LEKEGPLVTVTCDLLRWPVKEASVLFPTGVKPFKVRDLCCTRPEGDGQKAERAGEIESSVRISFTWEVEYLLGHGSSFNEESPKTNHIRRGGTQRSVL
jgi:hypothetical protein